MEPTGEGTVEPGVSESVATLRHATRSGLWAIGAYAGSAGAAFAISIIVGRVLGATSLGRYSYYLWVLRVAPTLVALGVPVALSKVVAEKMGSGAEPEARGVYRLVLRTHVLVLGPLGAAAIAVTAGVDSDAVGLIAVLVGGGLVALLVLDVEGMLAGLRRFRDLSIVSTITGVAQVVATAVGVALGLDWLGLLGVFVSVGAVSLAAMFVLTRRAVARIPVQRLSRPAAISFGRFAAVAAVTVVVEALLWGRLELLFLHWFRDSEVVGHYSGALRLASLAGVLPLVAARPLLPEFARLRSTGDEGALHDVFHRSCAVLAAVAVPIALVGAAVSPSALRLLYGREFSPAATATVVLTATSLLLALAGPLGMALLTGPRPRGVVELGVFGISVNVALDLLLVPLFGMNGAAAATAAAQAAWVLLAVVLVRGSSGLRYPVRRLLRGLVAGACGAAVAAAVSSVTGDAVTVVVGGGAGVATYVIAGLRFGALERGDLAVLGLSRRG